MTTVEKLDCDETRVIVELPEPKHATITFRFAPPDQAADKPPTFKVAW